MQNKLLEKARVMVPDRRELESFLQENHIKAVELSQVSETYNTSPKKSNDESPLKSSLMRKQTSIQINVRDMSDLQVDKATNSSPKMKQARSDYYRKKVNSNIYKLN